MIRVARIIYKYCYDNGNGVPSFYIKMINKSYTNKYNELVTTKPTTSVCKKGMDK